MFFHIKNHEFIPILPISFQYYRVHSSALSFHSVAPFFDGIDMVILDLVACWVSFLVCDSLSPLPPHLPLHGYVPHLVLSRPSMGMPSSPHSGSATPHEPRLHYVDALFAGLRLGHPGAGCPAAGMPSRHSRVQTPHLGPLLFPHIPFSE